MPKKSQKIAARQAELSGHKRKAHRRGPTGVPEIDQSIPQQLEGGRLAHESGTSISIPSRREAQVKPNAAPPTAVAHKFIGAELIQIGTLTVVMLSLLFVASFILN